MMRQRATVSAILATLAVVGLTSRSLAAVLGDVAPVGPYGHSFCPGVDPATQSPLAIVKDQCEIIADAAPINHTWLHQPLPMDLATGTVSIPGPVVVKLSNATMYINVEPNRFRLYHDGLNYSMIQMHVHLPAEHAIDGTLPQMELHMVHVNNASEIAVLGFVFKLGAPSQFMEAFLNHLPPPTINNSTNTTEYAPGEVSLPNGLPIKAQEWAQIEHAMAGPFFSYNGSLTTPPCAAGVHWVVFEKDWGLTLSRDQIKQFQRILHDVSGTATSVNNRVPFPMNGRRVEYHSVDIANAIYNTKLQDAQSKQLNPHVMAGPAARKLLNTAQ